MFYIKIAFLSVLVVMLATALHTGNFKRSLKPLLKTFSSAATKAASAETAVVRTVTHPAFELVEATKISEYAVDALMYKHKHSGALVLSIIAPQDDNKVFGITFRTPPTDSTGIPHILEHSVLCGSRKFPVKEPFVDLMRGSLQTFLNAFTYPDRTCYPVASMNTKDFYNLIHVYLDAVLYPKAVTTDMVLKQEGWHYELEKETDPLTLKGVVYNEMKGVYSSPDSLLSRAAQQALFPDNTYGVDSGGDPDVIPQLSFEQFKSFHQDYYHPSNSRIYFYGDDDPLKRLQLLDEYLTDFEVKNVRSQVQWQSKNFAAPKKMAVEFPVSSADSKHMLTVNWLLNDDKLTPKEGLALAVLNHLLLGTSSSSLRKTLTESQLGDSVTGGGLSDELLQSTFSVGLKGVTADNCEKVEKLVVDSLKALAATGFESEDIQSSLNTIEFSLREFNTGSFPRGLSLMLGIVSKWIYDQDGLDGVRFESALSELKADLKRGEPVFQSLLKKYIVSNNHRVTVEMKPNLALEKMTIQAEEERLAAVKSSMSSGQLQEIVEGTKKLKAMQAAEDTPEDRATIPRLSLGDIERTVKTIPITVVSRAGEGVVLTHDLETSGILYADIAFDMKDIDPADVPLIPLFTRLLMESGTAHFDDVTLSRKIGTNTGGLGASVYADVKQNGGKVTDPNSGLLYLMLRGKCVRDKIGDLFGLVQEVLLHSNVATNQKRAVEILKETKVRRESSVISSGHTYGATRLGAQYSFLGYYNEKTGGISFVRELGALLTQAESDWPTFSSRLQRLQNSIVRSGGAVINLTADKQTLAVAQSSVDALFGALPVPSASSQGKGLLFDSWSAASLLPKKNEGFSMPSQVNYVCKAVSAVPQGDRVKGSYSVVSRFLSTGYLWENVRVMGGAYGGFARLGEDSGRFVLMSYRDPNLSKTLDVYNGLVPFLAKAVDTLQDEDILQAVVGAVGDLDSPMTADQKGFASMSRYLAGETDEERQQWRDEVLQTSKTDFKDFADKLAAAEKTSSVVVFGSGPALEAAVKDMGENTMTVSPAF